MARRILEVPDGNTGVPVTVIEDGDTFNSDTTLAVEAPRASVPFAPSDWMALLMLPVEVGTFVTSLLAIEAIAMHATTNVEGIHNLYCGLGRQSAEWTMLMVQFAGFFPLITEWTYVDQAVEIVVRKRAYYRMLEYGSLLDFKNRGTWWDVISKSKLVWVNAVGCVLLACIVSASGNIHSLMPLGSLMSMIFFKMKAIRNLESFGLVSVNKFVENGKDAMGKDDVEAASLRLDKYRVVPEEVIRYHYLHSFATSTPISFSRIGQPPFAGEFTRAKWPSAYYQWRKSKSCWMRIRFQGHFWAQKVCKFEDPADTMFYRRTYCIARLCKFAGIFTLYGYGAWAYPDAFSFDLYALEAEGARWQCAGADGSGISI